MIIENIRDKKRRNIMIIVDNFEFAIEYAEGLCLDKAYRTFQGSDFASDLSEQTGLIILSEIVTCMEQGIVIILYSLEMLY